MLAIYNQDYIIIDQWEKVDQHFELLTQMNAWNIATLHISVTSRLKKNLEHNSEAMMVKQTRIDEDVVNPDINSYIIGRLKRDFTTWLGNVRCEVETDRVASADSM